MSKNIPLNSAYVLSSTFLRSIRGYLRNDFDNFNKQKIAEGCKLVHVNSYVDSNDRNVHWNGSG